MDYSKFKQKIRSRDEDRVKKYADGGSVLDDVRSGLPVVGDYIARGLRSLRGPSEPERKVGEAAANGAAGTGGSLIGRATRKPQNTSNPSEEIDI